MSQDDFMKVFDWFKTVVTETTEQGGQKNLIDWKHKHTLRVLKWGEKIMEQEKNIEWDYNLGRIVCLLHDIGRFPQSKYNTFNDKISINHAKVGGIMWKNREMFRDTKIMAIIKEAIDEHNNPYYSGNNIYVKLVRDADQMTILDEYKEQIESYEYNSGLMSENIKKLFLNKKIINSQDNKTLGDWIATILIWMEYFNFPSTKEFCRENRLNNKIIKEYLDYCQKNKLEVEKEFKII